MDVPSLNSSSVHLSLGWLVGELREKGYSAPRTIVYCYDRKHCSALFRYFATEYPWDDDFSTRPYAMFHTSTDHEIKVYIVQDFSNEHGTVRYIFTTTAFGLGKFL